jgi:hypothetical protein
MKNPKYREMSNEEFEGYSPQHTEEAVEAHQKEVEFREWCKEQEEDPQNENIHKDYLEMLQETGQAFWDGLDPNDKAGYEDNMNKDD